MGQIEETTGSARPPSRAHKLRTAGELVITTGTVLGVVGGTLVGVATPAGAATNHVVDSTADDGSGGLTLREAIAAAVDGDTISFDLPAGSTISLTSAQLDVTTSLEISGPGSEGLTIQAAEGERAFYLYAGLAGPVTISGLTIAGGDAVEGDGGGIFASRTDLALDDVVLDGNHADGDGGGLALEGGSLVMTDSAAVQNDAGAFGGGIAVDRYQDIGSDNPDLVTISGSTLSGNTASSGGGASLHEIYGPLTVDHSVVTGNQAQNEFDGKYLGAGLLLGRNFSAEILDTTISGNTSAGAGGGVAQLDYAGPAPAPLQGDGPVEAAAPSLGSLRVERTTISGNDALGSGTPAGGGGLWVGPGQTNVDVVNSTISGNTASGAGGGVYAPFGSFGDKYVSLRHSTIVDNTATYAGGVLGDNPGDGGYSRVQAYHTIVANNTATEAADDIGDAMEARYSLVEDTDDGVVVDQGGNIFGTDPRLGGLANNGGPTLTHLPNGGSPVVNAGDPNIEAVPETDQRGMSRITGGRIDIGAVEGSGRVQLPIGPCEGAPDGAFADVTASNVHHAAVDCLAHLGIAMGGPQGLPEDRYGPSLEVTRGQMASFLARLISRAGATLPQNPPDAFTDDDGDPHEADINALVAAGVVEGFEDGTYRSGDPVRRDQMASFLFRTHDLLSAATLPAGEDAFDDDEPGNVHEAAINALAHAGVIEGTATPRIFDPAGDVRRDQMASFLIRLAQLLSSEGEFPVAV